jgi:CubicO group peptidase (beta-lactamase class C family)
MMPIVRTSAESAHDWLTRPWSAPTFQLQQSDPDMRPEPAVACLLMLLAAPPLDSNAMQLTVELDFAWERVRGPWEERAREDGIVGASLALMDDGRIVEWAFYGQADRSTSRAVDENTIYHWASITKTFTGIAVMQLRDRGLLSLDDPIVDYLPELREIHNPFGDMRAITIRHLMSHASGLRAPTWPWGGWEDWHPHEPTSWAQLVAMFPYTEIEFEPGSTYSYSNPGVIFLGRVIELLTGDDYEVYMEKNVLRPLGMNRSYFDGTPYHLLRYRSNSYFLADGELTENGLDFDTGITVSNGGLNAPITDMARYLAFLTGAVEPDSDAAGVLERSSLEEMWTAQQPIALDEEGSWSMGLSFFLLESAPAEEERSDGQGLAEVDRGGRGTDRIIGHTGSQKGFRSFFYVNPATGAGAIAVYNTIVRVRSEDGDLEDYDSGFVALRRRMVNDLFPLLATER